MPGLPIVSLLMWPCYHVPRTRWWFMKHEDNAWRLSITVWPGSIYTLDYSCTLYDVSHVPWILTYLLPWITMYTLNYLVTWPTLYPGLLYTLDHLVIWSTLYPGLLCVSDQCIIVVHMIILACPYLLTSPYLLSCPYLLACTYLIASRMTSYPGLRWTLDHMHPDF